MLLRIIETFKDPKNMPRNLSKLFKPIADINLESIEPRVFKRMKEIKNNKIKLTKFFIDSESLISLT